MLENSVWKQYNSKSIHEVLVANYGVQNFEINDDESEIFTILKRDLTKKELKYFAMVSAEIEASKIQETLHVEDEEFEKIKKKMSVKFRRNKLKEALRGRSKE